MKQGRGYFITGSDTGVGKTLVACAMLHALAQRKERAIGMKPVAAGATMTALGLINDDVLKLQAASNVQAPLAMINPYCFEIAIAPHLAAQASGVTIAFAPIHKAFAALSAIADLVVVEGVGGFCVPLNDRKDSADLAHSLGLPLILVVGMRLGCINHTLLTVQAIVTRGMRLAGWVANRIDPQMQACDGNVSALRERVPAPLLGDIAYSSAPDPSQIARELMLP